MYIHTEDSSENTMVPLKRMLRIVNERLPEDAKHITLESSAIASAWWEQKYCVWSGVPKEWIHRMRKISIDVIRNARKIMGYPENEYRNPELWAVMKAAESIAHEKLAVNMMTILTFVTNILSHDFGTVSASKHLAILISVIGDAMAEAATEAS